MHLITLYVSIYLNVRINMLSVAVFSVCTADCSPTKVLNISLEVFTTANAFKPYYSMERCNWQLL